MFTDENVKLVVAAATAAGIDPSALLSVVECETNGAPFEIDGRTPTLLFERHIAFREAAKKGKSVQDAFIKAGLAIPHWDKATQYKDEGTSANRLALITKARAVNEEVANASASWGLGQTLGNQFEELGFESATDLVDYMTEGGLTAQIKVLVTEIKAKSLVKALNTKDWATFARRYNGADYKANQYDTKMAAADKRWSRKLPAVTSRAVQPVYQSLNRRQIGLIQQKLVDLGYRQVGLVDGKWGANTTGAINAFQANEGVPESGDFDEATKAAMQTAQPKIVDADRASATADDLRGKSKTVDTADRIDVVGSAKKWAGALMVGAGAAEQGGLLGQAQTVVDQANQAKGLWEQVHGFIEPLTGNPTLILVGIVLIAAGFFVSKYAKKIIDHRLADHQSGAHTGNTVAAPVAPAPAATVVVSK